MAGWIHNWVTSLVPRDQYVRVLVECGRPAAAGSAFRNQLVTRTSAAIARYDGRHSTVDCMPVIVAALALGVPLTRESVRGLCERRFRVAENLHTGFAHALVSYCRVWPQHARDAECLQAVVGRLVDLKVPIDGRSEVRGETPLTRATGYQFFDIATALVRAGADPIACDGRGRNALACADDPLLAISSTEFAVKLEERNRFLAIAQASVARLAVEATLAKADAARCRTP